MSLSRLHPLSFGELLDGVFSLYRRHFAPLLATSAMMALPSVLVYGVLAVLAGGDPASDATLSLFFSLVALPVSLVAVIGGWGALTQEAAAGVLGGEVSWRHGVRAARRRFWTLAAVSVVGYAAFMVGLLLFVVPAFLVTAMLFAVFPVVVVEGAPVPDALTRSRDLARGAWGRILLVITIFSIIGYLPILALWGGAIVFGLANPSAAGLWGSLEAQSIANMGAALVSAFTAPLLPLALTLLYFDRRVRVEALDLAEAPAAPAVPA